MIELRPEAVYVTTANRVIHAAARIGRGPLLTSEACNVDDSRPIEAKSEELDALEAGGYRWCETCGTTALG